MSMLGFFEPLKKLTNFEKIAIDNYVFRLHYKVTVIIFILFTFMVTAKQYFGEPINCLAEGVPANIVNVHCWVHGTFTIRELSGSLHKMAVSGGTVVAHPG